MFSKFLSLSLCIFFSTILNAEIGVSDTSITFGQSAALSGNSSVLGTELRRGAEIYFDHVNSTGGINGRKINVISLDDRYEGEDALFNTIELITKRKVFNLFGYVGTPTIVRALPVIQKFSSANLILFSNFTGAQPQRENPHFEYVFNVRSSYRQETAGLVDRLVAVGHTRIGVFIQSDAYGRSGQDGVRRALDKYNLKIISEVAYSRGVPYSTSMKQQAQKLIKDDVTAVISIGAYAACAAFVRDARDHGFKGPIANISFAGAESLLRFLLIEEQRTGRVYTNKLLNSHVVPLWTDLSFPLVKEFHETANKFYAKFPHLNTSTMPKFSFVSLEGFLNAKVLTMALRNSPKHLTRQNFKEAILKMRSFKVGLKSPLSFTSEKHQASDLIFYSTVKNGSFVKITKWADFQ